MSKSTHLFLLFVLFVNSVSAQSVGDYRSASTGNWTNLASWQYYNGSTWATPTGTSPQGWPGQYSVTGAVLIRTGHKITINSTITTVSFGTLTVTGTLFLDGDNTSGGMNFNLNTTSIVVTPSAGFIEFDKKVNLNLPANASLQVSAGGLDNAVSGCNANQIIYIGGTAYSKCNGGGSLPDFGVLMTNGGTLNAIPTSNSPLCNNATVNLTGNYSGRIGTTTSGGGTAGVNYAWSVIAPDASTITSTLQNYSFAATQSGNYTATLTCSTYYGTDLFTNFETQVVVVNPLPTISGVLPVCVGATITLTGSATADPTLPWASANSSIATITSAGVVTGIASGTSLITYRNANGCTRTATITVNDLPNNTGSGFSANTICAGGSPLLTFDALDSGFSGPWSITYKNNASPTVYTQSIATAAATSFAPGDNPSSNASYTLLSIANINCTRSTGFGNATASLNVRPLPTASISGTTAVCINASSPNITFTNPQTAAVTITYTINGGVNQTQNVAANSLVNLPVSTTVAGTFVYALVSVIYQNPSICSNPISGSATITVNAPSAAPILTLTQPSCSVPTGTITVTSPAPSSGISYTVVGTSPVVGGVTNATGVFSGLPAGVYGVTVNISLGCGISLATAATINPTTNTWNGTAWSNGTPTSSQALVFSGSYPPSPDPDVDIVGCSCTISSGANITIRSGRTLTISNAVGVSSGTLTFENAASLVQLNNVINTGNIIYNRTTPSLIETDYTYWSSPVSGQTLNISSDYAWGTFYSYNSSIDNWQAASLSTAMIPGRGYIMRGQRNNNNLYNITGTFTGVPNNGLVTVATGPVGRSILLGNPYPSALDAESFLDFNSSVLEGTIYFWTHRTAIQAAANIVHGSRGSGVYAYTSDDYAVYNSVGGVGLGSGTASVSGSLIPSGKIASGQGFFGTISGTGPVIFNNDMRVGVGGITGNNAQFFRTSSDTKKNTAIREKHRVWLNLTNKQGAFKQTLLGYVTSATNELDSRFDGESFDSNLYIDFYSLNQNKNLTIQGRSLPFDQNDQVALGFKSTLTGSFTISIDQVDGLMTHQDIFLEDKLTHSITNLKTTPYDFTTTSGTFNNRFVLRYTNKTLGVDDLESHSNTVLVSVKNKQIKINSTTESITQVRVFDLLGRKIYDKSKINAQEWSVTNLSTSDQVLTVKTTLDNGVESSKKIILN